MQFCNFFEHLISSKYWQKSYSRWQKSYLRGSQSKSWPFLFNFSPFRNNEKTAASSLYNIFCHHVTWFTCFSKCKNGILRVDVLRRSLALCVWKVAKTTITIPITLRVGLVTWKNINSCIRWYYHLKNSQNVTFNEFSNITSECQNGSWRPHRANFTLRAYMKLERQFVKLKN